MPSNFSDCSFSLCAYLLAWLCDETPKLIGRLLQIQDHAIPRDIKETPQHFKCSSPNSRESHAEKPFGKYSEHMEVDAVAVVPCDRGRTDNGMTPQVNKQQQQIECSLIRHVRFILLGRAMMLDLAICSMPGVWAKHPCRRPMLQFQQTLMPAGMDLRRAYTQALHCMSIVSCSSTVNV